MISEEAIFASKYFYCEILEILFMDANRVILYVTFPTGWLIPQKVKNWS